MMFRGATAVAGALLLLSAAAKWSGFGDFASVVQRAVGAGASSAKIFAAMLDGMELAVGVWMFLWPSDAACFAGAVLWGGLGAGKLRLRMSGYGGDCYCYGRLGGGGFDSSKVGQLFEFGMAAMLFVSILLWGGGVAPVRVDSDVVLLNEWSLAVVMFLLLLMPKDLMQDGWDAITLKFHT